MIKRRKKPEDWRERQILRKKILLIPGGVTLISIETDVSKSFVSQVLKGIKNSDKVIDAAIKISENRNQIIESRKQKIKSL